MSWVKIDDQYADHPKVAAVGPLGMALHVAAMCYCAKYLTDGFVPDAILPRLINWDGISVVRNGVTNAVSNVEVTEEVTDAGLFDKVDGGVMVHDYLMYNPTREQALAERQANAERQAVWRAAHPKPKPTRHAVSNGVSNAVSNGRVTGAPSPSPSPSPSLSPSPLPVPESPDANASGKPARDVNLDHPAVVMYRKLTHITPHVDWRAKVAEEVTDLELWKKIIDHWLGMSWNKGAIKNMLDAYAKGGVGSNGNKAVDAVRKPYSVPDGYDGLIEH